MKKAKDAGEVFARIMEDLQHTYLLGYAAPSGTPGAWREINIRVHDVKSPVVRSKSRYLLR